MCLANILLGEWALPKSLSVLDCLRHAEDVDVLLREPECEYRGRNTRIWTGREMETVNMEMRRDMGNDERQR